MKKVHGEIYPMIFQLSTLSLISGTLYQTTGERLPSWPYLEKHKKCFYPIPIPIPERNNTR